ncbi:hypothetical protein FACS189429_4050 [Bacteroidia bacterium]|nr:hypothetical protein FACS189429_4050 [Bacteroidia bacterium]
MNNNLASTIAAKNGRIAQKRSRTKSTALNPAQIHLLEMLSFAKTEQSLLDLKHLLREFYIRQIDIKMNEYWKEGKFSDAINEQLLQEHLRTPYK